MNIIDTITDALKELKARADFREDGNACALLVRAERDVNSLRAQYGNEEFIPIEDIKDEELTEEKKEEIIPNGKKKVVVS